MISAPQNNITFQINLCPMDMHAITNATSYYNFEAFSSISDQIDHKST